MDTIPESMQAVALSSYGQPSTYQTASLPTPSVTQPDEILIRTHAASVNPIDVKFAGGMAKMMQAAPFPYKIGFDVAGTVVAIGSTVSKLKIGDEVYSRIPNRYRGSVAEYVLSTEEATALKPESLSFEDAASIPLAGLTALQCMELADKQLPGGLEGKTVFIPAGLGGTGSFAVQLARNVFKAGKVITTLSTKKIPKATEFFGDDGIELIDYTKEDIVNRVGRSTVDYFFDTMGGATKHLAVVKRGGVIVSISTMPSGTQMKSYAPDIPFLIEKLLNCVDHFYTWWCGRAGVHYKYILMEPSADGLNQFSGFVKDGKVKPLVGKVASLQDVQSVRNGCQEIYDGKGGLGKFVIKIV
ncbi:GroES-like protein [Annulohypoxylon bovei var. microspora]|nr:GroES-like protein [Annulohypoxylon bovei var. microspora]